MPHPVIARFLINIWNSIKGKSNQYLKTFKESQWLSTDEVREIQWNKLQTLLAHAYNNVPYYRKMFEKLNLHPDDIQAPEDMQQLPILTKKDIRGNLSDLIATNYDRTKLIANSTGGSTGENLHFYQDLNYASSSSAATIRGDSWTGWKMGEKRAYIWGAPMDISKRTSIKGKIVNWMTNTLFLSAYKLSEESMHEYAQELKRFRPKLLIGYSSVLALFAEFLQANDITNVSPEAIISSAEALYPYQRELIESVFNCKVFNRYGSREVNYIACECDQHNGMHINAERVYLEFLKDNTPDESGESAEIIVTSLDNYGMPFIRYAIEDIGIPSNRICNCGRGLPLMENVEGRSFDIIVGTNGNKLGGTFWTILLRKTVQGIKQFQVIQTTKSKLDIKIVKDDSLFDSSCISQLVENIKEYCGSDMKVEFQIVSSITPAKSGKHRFIISEIFNRITDH